MQAVLNGTVVAESTDTIVVEGNHYFPPSSVNTQYFTPTDRSTGCPWKGTASYYTVAVDGAAVDNAAWYYPDPLEGAANIKGYVAFYPSVTVTD